MDRCIMLLHVENAAWLYHLTGCATVLHDPQAPAHAGVPADWLCHCPQEPAPADAPAGVPAGWFCHPSPNPKL